MSDDDFELPVEIPAPDLGLAQDLAQDLAEKEAQRQEATIRDAIRKTDWSETAVLDIVTYQPNPMIGTDIELADTKVCRYSEQAPPMSDYADGDRQYDVRRITEPLLDRLTDEHPELQEALDDGE